MLEIFRPVKPCPINQSNLFGANPDDFYTSHNLGKGHPGIDIEVPSGTPLYAPVNGVAKYVKDNLGGDGLHIRTDAGDGHIYNIILWHLFPAGTAGEQFQIPTDGSETPVKIGQLLAYTDNSGYPRESSGPHLHLGVQELVEDAAGAWTAKTPNNGFGGCEDPMPYLQPLAAQDVPVVESAIQRIASEVQLLAEEIKQYIKSHV